MHLKTRRARANAIIVITCLTVLAAAGIRPSQAQSATDAPLDFSGALATASQMPRLHSLLISHEGELVLERYFNGRSANDIANIKSASKSIISALVGIAIEQGHIEGVDQPIGDFFEEELRGEDAAKSRITIGNLLSMQSGLETTSNRNYGAWVLSSDWVDWALAQPLESRPGGRMIYSTGNTHLLSAIITRATGQDTLDFARGHLSAPLGFRLAPWPRSPEGYYFGGNDMEMTPRQMLAIGELYLEGGRAGDTRVIPADWIERSFEPRVLSPRDGDRAYGYGWWIRDMAGFETPYAWGYGGQFIVLVEDLDLVIVTTSSSNPGDDRRRHTRRIYDLVEFGIIEEAARALGQERPQLDSL